MRRMQKRARLGCAIAAAAMAVTSAHAAYTWNAASGTWSAAGSWDVNGVPSTDGTGDVILQSGTANTTATVDTGWGTPADRSINSLTFAGSNRIDLGAQAGVTLNVGAGGVTWSGTQQGQVSAPINFNTATSQIVVNPGSVIWNGNVSSSANTVITKSGTGELRINGGSSIGAGGSFVLEAGAIRFFNDGGDTNQYKWLGTVGLTVKDTSVTTLGFNATASKASNQDTPDVVRTFTTPLVLDGTFAGNTFGINSAGAYPSNFRLDFDGPISSTSALTGRSTGSIGFSVGGLHMDDRTQTWLNGDGSGLSSTADVSAGLYAVLVRSGHVVLNNVNALGAGNSLGVAMHAKGSAGDQWQRHRRRHPPGLWRHGRCCHPGSVTEPGRECAGECKRHL